MFVCLVDATGKQVLDGVQLEAGQRTRSFRSQRFRANFGNGSVRMSVNGKTLPRRGRRAADRLRVPARQEASPAFGVGARGALRVTVRAGIVVTGTEVLSGLIRDANGPWLSEALASAGRRRSRTSWSSATGRPTSAPRSTSSRDSKST